MSPGAVGQAVLPTLRCVGCVRGPWQPCPTEDVWNCVVGSWDVLQGLLSQAGVEPHGQPVARWALSLCAGTAPLPRSAARFCAGISAASSAPALCSRTAGRACLQPQSLSPCLPPRRPVSPPRLVLLPPAPISALLPGPTPQDPESPQRVAVGLCPGEMCRVERRGRWGAGRSPRPGAGAGLASPAVGGEQAASDVTAVHGG